MDRPPAREYLTVPDTTLIESSVVSVALNGSVRSVVESYSGPAGLVPEDLAVVCIGDQQRNATAAAAGDGAPSTPANVSVASVSSPGDLTGIGIKLSQCLSSWEKRGTSMAVDIDSLTTLLQFADVKRVFQFAHVLTGRIDSAGAVGFFHLDPGAHDAQTIATLRGLFDAVYEYGPDGWREA